jgi:hypothetical protein
MVPSAIALGHYLGSFVGAVGCLTGGKRAGKSDDFHQGGSLYDGLGVPFIDTLVVELGMVVVGSGSHKRGEEQGGEDGVLHLDGLYCLSFVSCCCPGNLVCYAGVANQGTSVCSRIDVRVNVEGLRVS